MSLIVFAVFIFFSAALGASMGSFLNVVASRTVEERSWWGEERSSCDSCGRKLTATELVPIVSWLVLRRGCRSCGAKIPLRYLGVEAAGAAIGALLAWRWGFSVTLIFAAAIASGLFLNALTDLYGGHVYDLFALGLGGAGMLMRIGGGFPGLTDGLLGALLGFGVIAVIIIASRGGMGWGDASLMAGTGAALGWQLTAWALYTGFMIGGAIALGLLASGRIKRKDAIPLGPFLALGGIVSIVTGPWFFSLFGIAVRWPWY
ncbi:MAG: prepilin peptidase [Thermovirgaceae bacterium]|nr:prepilin peptidase [Thermovirgaceae bacterium]